MYQAQVCRRRKVEHASLNMTQQNFWREEVRVNVAAIRFAAPDQLWPSSHDPETYKFIILLNVCVEGEGLKLLPRKTSDFGTNAYIIRGGLFGTLTFSWDEDVWPWIDLAQFYGVLNLGLNGPVLEPLDRFSGAETTLPPHTHIYGLTFIPERKQYGPGQYAFSKPQPFFHWRRYFSADHFPPGSSLITYDVILFFILKSSCYFIMVRVPAEYFHANVWAMTQHTFECPYKCSKVCCDVTRTLVWK